MLTVVELETAAVVTWKAATELVAAIVTLAGTVATALLLLESEMTVPPLGAGPFRVTSPVEEAPPLTLMGLRLIEDRAEEGGGGGPVVPLPAPLQEIQQSATANSPNAAAKPGRRAGPGLRLREVVAATLHRTQQARNPISNATSLGGRLFQTTGDAAAVRAVVCTVTTAVAECVPSSVTKRGVITQVEAGGRPPQLKVTVWLNPLRGVSVSV